MSDKLLHILQHSLGVDKYGRGEQYRNRFVTGPDSSDFETCIGLCNLGLMRDHGANSWCGGMHVFEVTKAGKEFVSQHSEKPPKRTRSQQRYDAWLKQDCAMPFGEYLKRATK